MGVGDMSDLSTKAIIIGLTKNCLIGKYLEYSFTYLIIIPKKFLPA